MLHLIDVSLSERDATAATLAASPLLAADADYRAKTWLATNPQIGLRPWRRSEAGNRTHVVGWSREAPGEAEGAKIRTRTFEAKAGTTLSLAGRFLPIRRCNNVQGNGRRTERDAAEGRDDPVAAYEAWLRERLIDLMPFADVESVTVDCFYGKTALRKGRLGRVQRTTIPVAEAIVVIGVREPSAVEDWLVRGVGPQKAFGYGAFIPVGEP